MAWGRKAAQIRGLQERLTFVREQQIKDREELNRAQDEATAARREQDRLQRKADELEHSVRRFREDNVDKDQRLNAAEARQRELEWAVALLNIARGRTGDDVDSPVTGATPAELEQAKEAVRERDVVVKWDELAGVPTVHFPKKDQRRAPWGPARTLFPVSIALGDLIYDPSRGSVGPFSPIGNPA